LSEVGELNGDLESHLSALQRGIRGLQKTQEDLFKRNQRLQCEIDRLHNQADVSIQPSTVKSGGKSSSLQMRVKELELKVRQLKKAHALDRKKIRQLRLKEAHKDAEELQDNELHGVPDVEHEMKKVSPQGSNSASNVNVSPSCCGTFTGSFLVHPWMKTRSVRFAWKQWS